MTLNYKSILKIVFFSLIFFFSFFSNVYAKNFPELNSKIALVYDLNSNEYIYTKNTSEKTPIASLTKIMTTMTALNLITDLDYNITISKDMLKGISKNASVAGLKVNDVVTYKDLLYASLLPSGADATQSLALSLTGNVYNFTKKMNELAKTIGMNNSRFLNTSGLDKEGQYSTAEDVLILLKYALNNPTFKEIFTTKEYTLQNGLEVKSTLRGYEEALEIDINRILGSKTGYTDYAGMCLASLIEVQGHEILIITINAPYVRNEFYNLKDHLAIIAYLDDNYSVEPNIVENNQDITNTDNPDNTENINNTNNTNDLNSEVKENNPQKNELYWLLGIPIIILIFLIFKITKKREDSYDY